MDMEHFEELKRRIDAQLEASRSRHRHAQVQEFPWLYGALGEVPSEVMFVCEYPSLDGVTRANLETVDGGPPDIEAQWWGGASNAAARRFRVALHELGLKETAPAEKGGWRCYITNVIKELNVAGDANPLTLSDRRQLAQRWAPILSWEIETVAPRHVFCVGNNALALVEWLVEHRLIPKLRPKLVGSYAARSSDAAVIDGIVGPVSRALGRPVPDADDDF